MEFGSVHSDSHQDSLDACASCQMSLPGDISSPNCRISEDGRSGQIIRPIRTLEQLHACMDQCENHEADSNMTFGSYLDIDDPPVPQPSCHKHYLEYNSSSSPAISTTYSALRNATIRTLSGEQLPRGHKSGPIYFGDSSIGYTIAYVFRLVDPLARGHHRFYAFLALAGYDSQRAIEACSMIWSFFEQIAKDVVETAEQVAAKKMTVESEHLTPASSFLAGPLSLEYDGFSRRGTTNIRPNGIASLVGNPNFFCDLHVAFVGMLRDLGKRLGGLRIMPAVQRLPKIDDDDKMNTLLDFGDGDYETRSTVTSPSTYRTSVTIEGEVFSRGSRASTNHCSSTLIAQAHTLAV